MSLSDEYRKRREEEEKKRQQQAQASNRTFGGSGSAGEDYRRYREQTQNAAKAQNAVVNSVNTAAAGAMAGADRATGHTPSYHEQYQRQQVANAMSAQAARNMRQAGLRQEGAKAYQQAKDRAAQADRRYRLAYNEDLRSQNPAAWYGSNLSREQISGQIRMLERQRDELQPQVSSAYDEWRNAQDDPTGRELLYEGRKKRLQGIEDELATYQQAMRYNDEQRYDELLAKYAPKGYLTDEMKAKREAGRLRYQQDQARTGAEAQANYSAELWQAVNEDRGMDARALRREQNDAGYLHDIEDAKHLRFYDYDVFYALYADDPEAAKEWARLAKQHQDQQFQANLAEWAGQDTGTRLEAFVLGTGANWASGVSNLLDPFSENTQEIGRAGRAMISGGAQGLTEKGIFNTGLFSGTIREDTPLIGHILGGKGLGDLYTLGSSILESTATAAVASHAGALSDIVQALGVVIMGSSAASADYDESLKRGLTEDQAMQHAIAAGLNEAAFEWISLDKLVNPNFGASVIKQWLTQSGIEASEEFCTTVANRLADGVLARANGYDTQIEQRMKELIAMGVDHDEARERAEHEWTTDLINDAIGGFISGGFSQIANVASGYGMSKFGEVADRMRYESDQARKMEQRGAAITNQEELQALQSYAKANGIQFDQDAAAKINQAGGTDSSADRAAGVRGPYEASAQNDSGGTGTDSSTSLRSAQNDKVSRKERRQQAKSNRSAGVVQEQVVRSITDTIQKRGLDQAQAVYDETVAQHGHGIARQAAAAVSRAASEQLGKLNNTAELEQAYRAASEGVTEPAVRKAIDQAYNIQAYAIAQRTGNEEAVERIQQRVRNTSASGKRNLSLEVRVTNEDGSSGTAQITGVTPNAEQVKLSNGQTVAVDQLTGIDADTKDVLDRIKFMEVGPAANLMWNAYQLEVKNGTMQDGYRWIMDYTVAFDQGRQGSVSLEQAIGRAEGLSPQIAEIAYQQGRDAAKQMTAEQKADLKKRMAITTKGATGRAGTVNTDAISDLRLSKAQEKQLAIVKRIAEVFGIDVEVFASGTKNVTVNGKRKQAFQGENGSYENGRIRLDINAGLLYIDDIGSGLVATLGHELTHFIQEFAPEEYQAYKEFVLATIAKNKGSQGLERLIQEKIDRSKGQNLSRTKAEDEVVADAAQTVLTDSQALRQMAEQEPTLFEKVLQWIKDFFDEIRDALAGSPRMSEEARLFRGLEAEVRKAFGEIWDKGITEAVRVHDQVGSQSRDALAEAAKDVEAVGASAQMAEEAAVQNSDRIDAGNVIPLSERFNRESPDIRFSMRDSVETTDRLIAWHNMNEDALRSALELGGLAMPSWAIKTADRAHTSYGSISVIAPKSLVDPKQNRNSMIFGGDAWTPVFPGVDYDISYEATEKLYDEIAGLIGENVMRELGGAAIDTENIANQLGNNSGGVSSYYKNNTALRYAYLKSIGKDIAIPQRETRLDDFGKYANKDVQLFADRLTHGSRSLKYYRDMSSSELMQQDDLKQAIADVMALNYGEAIRKFYAPDQLGFNDIHAMLEAANKYFEANGVIPGEADKYALAKEIDKVIDEEAYEKWIGNKLNQTIRKKGIRNNKDTFTPSGNRRSFDALHYAYNLANIVKAMKAQPKQGRTQFLSGPGSVKGAALKSYNTVDQVRADRGRLVDSAEEGQAAYDEYNRNLEDILDRMSKNGDRFDAADALIEVFQHAKTEAAIYNYMQRELKDWYNISRDLAHDVYALIGQINRLPMEYFEGKTYDAVGFDETAAVVVPDSIDQSLKRQLQQAGARVLEYKAGDNEDRLAKVNSVEEAKFSERDYSYDFSDTDLILDAADLAADPETAESYWKELLATMDQKDARDARAQLKGIREQGKKIQELETKLENALHQMEQTDRKLRTQGIGNVTKAVMEEFEVSDAKKRGVAKKATEAITQAYQKALDAMDNGAEAAAATDILYEGAVKAANILLDEGTHTERHFGKWAVGSYSSYIKEDRQLLVDAMVSKVYEDFAVNRYREPMKATAADRLVERTERRMQKKIDEARDRARTVQEANDRLQRDMEYARNEADASKQQVGELAQQLRDLRDQVKEDKQLTGQERSKAQRRIKTLENALKAKRSESQAWKQLADRQARQMEKDAHAQTIQGINSRVDLFRERLSRTNEELRANKAERALNDTTRKLNETARKLSSTANQLQKQLEREQRILNGMLKPPAIQKLLKAEREKAVAKAEAHKDEVFRNYKDRRRQSDLRQRIKNLSNEMKRRMTTPSERAYVPASLYGSMTQLADVLDEVLSPASGTKAKARYRAMMDAIHGLAREYEGVKSLDDSTYASEYDEEIRDAISDIERLLERKNATWIDQLTGDTVKGFREMDTGELQRLYDLMRQINYNMIYATRMLGDTSYSDLFDAMRAVADQQNSMESRNSVGWAERNRRTRLLGGLSVMRAVEMMSGWDRDAALYQLMHAIEQGSDDSWSWVMAYNKSLQDLKTGKNEKEYRNALTKKLDYGVKDEEGQTALMTKLQALQILMTAEREAHNDKLLHLQTGGAVIRNATDLQNGKGAKARSQTVKVTQELLQRIQNDLTPWDKAYMKAIRDYFQREGKATNEILYKLKHKVLQTEEYYVPYNVDSNYLETNLNEQQAMNMWVKMPGSTNALKQKAKQPVIIDGMDTVMARHVKEIADYIGMAIPIRDFSKVYNGMIPTGEDNPLPVKETIDRTFGKEGQHLLTQAVIDVQGGRQGQSWRSGIAEFLNKLQSAFVKSALLVNPSVTIKQAASYVAAESILSHRAIVAGNRALFAKDDKSKSPAMIAYLFANPDGRTAQRIYNEIDQHTSLHYQRRQGMSQAEIAEQANRNGPVKRWMNGVGASMEQNRLGHAIRRTGENLNPMAWIQRMDVATTATLWLACKHQARMDLGITDSSPAAQNDAFWQRTTELYERVIRETQPMYDGLHRTAHQKQSGGLVQFLFPFRTVPIQNHGQLAASYEALKASKGKSKAQQAAARKFFAKTVWAQTASAFIFSLMTFIAAGLKRKTKKYRDEDEEFTAESFAKGMMTDIGATLFSVLQPMYGSELVSWGGRALDKFEGTSGFSYDAFSVGVVDMLNDLISSSDKVVADAGKLFRGEDVSFSDISSHGTAMLLKAAKIAGIPADTVKTYAQGLLANVQDLREGRIPAINDESWNRATAVNVNRYAKAWEAGDSAKMQAVIAEMNRNLEKDGKSTDGARDAVSKAAKERYEAGEIEIEAYMDFLRQAGYLDEEKIQNKVRDILRDELSTGDRSEEDVIDALVEYVGWDEDKAWKKVQEWSAKAEHAEDEDYNWGQYDEIHQAIDSGKDIKGLTAELVAHGVAEKNITQNVKSYLVSKYEEKGLNETQFRNMLSRYCGIVAKKDVDEIVNNANCFRDSGYHYNELREAYNSKKLEKAKAQSMLQKYGGMTAVEAKQRTRYWDFQVKYPDAELSQAKVDAYYDTRPANFNQTMQEAGISMTDYIRYATQAAKATGTDADGDGKTDSGSKKAAIMQIINALPLSSNQKDALYYLNGWSAKTLQEAPWH